MRNTLPFLAAAVIAGALATGIGANDVHVFVVALYFRAVFTRVPLETPPIT